MPAAPERWPRSQTASASIKAVAFDAFPILDPRSVFAFADAMYPAAGLSDEWRMRQFEYTWLRVAARRYVDFWHVTEDALVFAANRLKLELSPDRRATLMNEFLRLRAWPDVIPALESIRRSGVRLTLLSNFTPRMLAANIASAGLHGMFEQVLSTDQVKSYKPDPLAYQIGSEGSEAQTSAKFCSSRLRAGMPRERSCSAIQHFG